MVLYRNIYRCVYIHNFSIYTYNPLLCPREPRFNDTPVTMSTLSSQILVSNAILQLKETRIVDKTDNFKIAPENIQEELGASLVPENKEVIKISINNEGMSKGHRGQLKGLPMAKAGIIRVTK